MTDTYVVGFESTDNLGNLETIYTQVKSAEYARHLAYSMSEEYEYRDDQTLFTGAVLSEYLGYAYPTRLGSHPFETTHTIHVVETLNQNVRLVDPVSGETKVTFTYDQFIDRYNRGFD